MRGSAKTAVALGLVGPSATLAAVACAELVGVGHEGFLIAGMVTGFVWGLYFGIAWERHNRR